MGFLKALVPVGLRPRLRDAFNRIYFFGFKNKCPFCGSRLKTFLPGGLDYPVLQLKKVVGGGRRRNVGCPVCGSADRERLLFLYLMLKTDIFGKPKRVLHVAPEFKLSGVLRASPNISYLSADISSKDVMIEMDITDIRYPDNSFDVIICNHVLEHIVDDAGAMSELFRTLKPGGWAILQVPISSTLDRTYEDVSITTASGRVEAFGQEDHVRIYASDYRDRLARAGFVVDSFNWTTEVENFGGRRNLFGLIEDECVYCVRKPI